MRRFAGKIQSALTIAALGLLCSVCGNLRPLPCRAEDPACNAISLVGILRQNSVSPSSGPQSFIYLYASNALHEGSWGDRSASSFACYSEQITYKPGLPCTNHLSFLSYTGDALFDAPTNHGIPTDRPIVSETGNTIDLNWIALFDGSIAQSFDGAGVNNFNSRFWTGTDPAGTANSDRCNEWTDNTGAHNGIAGSTTATDNTWTNAESAPCSDTKHYICACW
ncbi:MAG: hypothetical protein KDK25_13225 [Leptospiraceae bacterium]|nr:hypothetical protein [Leptospiraceae bacterium]